MTTPGTLDFSFDRRVATQYDALRAHPPEASRAIGTAIAAIARTAAAATRASHAAGDRAVAVTAPTGAGAPAGAAATVPRSDLAPAPEVLELGVGTGRIALPVAAAGCAVVGVDLSAQMLEPLRRHCAQEPSLRIACVRGDLAALPFAPRSFDAVLAVHVLHLVADWRSTLERVAAVLRPGGALLLGRDWVDPASAAGRIRMAFRQAVMTRGFGTASPAGGPALEQALGALGLHRPADAMADVAAAEWRAEISPSQVLDGIRSRDDAESWVLPDEILIPVADELDAFARREWPDVTRPQTIARRFVLSVFRAAA